MGVGGYDAGEIPESVSESEPEPDPDPESESESESVPAVRVWSSDAPVRCEDGVRL